MTRHVCYVSGTRADFGLMASTLKAIAAHPAMRLSVLATGMHLSPTYGDTVRDIEAAGLTIAARVPVLLEPATGATMARAIGTAIGGMVDAFERLAPDVVLLLGDRGEMLAGAIAAIHLNVPVVHVHGGERSGTVDEPVRHAISKLAHLHLAATADAGERLVRMGEAPERVHVVGAPGIDDLLTVARTPRNALLAAAGFVPARPLALMVHHPVLQEGASGAAEAGRMLSALRDAGLQVLALRPNADAGSDAIRSLLDTFDCQDGVRVVTHLSRAGFISWMAAADVMIGNSSAGIIEAASFGTPVINVGSRQRLRERNANVVDVEAEPAALARALASALQRGRFSPANVYGDGRAAARIVTFLASQKLDAAVMVKCNAY